MKTNILFFFLMIVLCSALLPTAEAAELSVDDIVKKANEMAYYQGDDGRARVSMTITDRQGRQRERVFDILRMNSAKAGEQKFYVYFDEPEDVRRMVFMVWKHLKSDDDRWLYLPALDLVRRIAAGDKRSSFAGSDFLYEDISGRSIEDDVHELEEESGPFYRIKNVPKDAKLVEFAYYYVWIDKNSFMPMKAEYYDAKDKLLRTVEALDVQDIQGYATVVKSRAVNHQTGSSTVSVFTDIGYDIGLDDNTFTERYLRRAPSRWIKP